MPEARIDYPRWNRKWRGCVKKLPISGVGWTTRSDKSEVLSELSRAYPRYLEIMGARQAAFTVSLLVSAASAQTFAVASIRPSAAQVQFEHDGKTEVTAATVTMRDVTVATCIKWAYGVQDSQISGPDWIQSEHFDIIAKADAPVATEQLKLMMEALLAERFRLAFHRQGKELRSYVMTVAKSGHKLREWDGAGKPSRENSAIGTVVKGMTIGEFADFMAGPLQAPVVDMTGLSGRYEFALDFRPYLPQGETVMKMSFDNTTGIIITAMQEELGLRMESRKEPVEVMVIDQVERPSEN
jgi:uncharacterized protein (TIGR03435 family)